MSACQREKAPLPQRMRSTRWGLRKIWRNTTSTAARRWSSTVRILPNKRRSRLPWSARSSSVKGPPPGPHPWRHRPISLRPWQCLALRPWRWRPRVLRVARHRHRSVGRRLHCRRRGPACQEEGEASSAPPPGHRLRQEGPPGLDAWPPAGRRLRQSQRPLPRQRRRRRLPRPCPSRAAARPCPSAGEGKAGNCLRERFPRRSPPRRAASRAQ